MIFQWIKDISRPMRVEYYNRKKWNNFYRGVKKTNTNNKKLSKEIKYINKPGISFSFDDSFRVDGWYENVKDLFGFYDIQATFNVNAYHHFEGQREHSQREIDKLLELQAHGHEIAHHTFKHHDAVLYSKECGVDKWVKDEIEPLFTWLADQRHSITKDKFKKPVSFAFPYFINDEKTIESISPSYFKIVRGGPRGALVTPFNHTGFAPSIDIDRNNLTNPKFIKKIIKQIKKTGSNLILTCHSVLPDDYNWDHQNFGKESYAASKFRISPETLNCIIKEAKKNNLEFYTTAEIAGIATFLDNNFEEYIRKLLSIPKNQWIKISDLVSIKELNLSYKNITNLDGIQYFLNLETLDISYNNISDLRLIGKLPKLKIFIQNDPVKKVEML